jgi:hypothetical protein
MPALLHSTADPSTSVSDPGTALTFSPGTVVRLEDDGHAVVQCGSAELHTAMASHVPGVVAGQMVLLAVPADAGLATAPPLVIAAWPTPGAPMTPPWHFDRSTGTLTLAANNLGFAAVNSVLLNCGDARMQFTRDGLVETRGQSITAAAIETHRIEGGSIELN